MAKHPPKPKYFQYARKMIFLGIVFVPLAPYLLALAIAYSFFISLLTQSRGDAMQQVLLDKKYAQAEWFGATRAAGHYVSDVFLGFRGEPHLVIARTGIGDTPPSPAASVLIS